MIKIVNVLYDLVHAASNIFRVGLPSACPELGTLQGISKSLLNEWLAGTWWARCVSEQDREGKEPSLISASTDQGQGQGGAQELT